LETSVQDEADVREDAQASFFPGEKNDKARKIRRRVRVQKGAHELKSLLAASLSLDPSDLLDLRSLKVLLSPPPLSLSVAFRNVKILRLIEKGSLLYLATTFLLINV